VLPTEPLLPAALTLEPIQGPQWIVAVYWPAALLVSPAGNPRLLGAQLVSQRPENRPRLACDGCEVDAIRIR
jgi:hypothetical protein